MKVTIHWNDGENASYDHVASIEVVDGQLCMDSSDECLFTNTANVKRIDIANWKEPHP